MKFQFSQETSGKCSNNEFHKNLSNGAKLPHADRHTDRHAAANNRFSQFCEVCKNELSTEMKTECMGRPPK